MTIRQLLDVTREHSEVPFQIGDIEAHRVCTHSISHSQPAFCSANHWMRCRQDLVRGTCGLRPHIPVYELEDATSQGRISARWWSSEADCDKLPDDYSKLYVDIAGHLDQKVQLNARNCVIIKHIHAVTDAPDRLFFHILDAAFVILSLQRGPPVCSFLYSERGSVSEVMPQPVTTEPNNDVFHNATTLAPTPVCRDEPTTPRRVAGSSSQSQPAVPARVRDSGPSTSSSSPRLAAPRTPVREAVSAMSIRQPAPTRHPVPAMIPSPSLPPSSPSPGPANSPPSRTPPPPQITSNKCVR